MIRLLLVDDHEMVRAGLRALLGHVQDFQVAGEAATAAQAIEVAGRVQPDVVLMDLRLPDGSGVDACREILSSVPKARVLFLTSYAEDLARMSTVLAGAAGYLLKEIDQQSLTDAIRDAASGRLVIDPAVTASVAQRLTTAPALSKQEYRILALVVEGKTNKQIGAELGLSEKTVRNYLSNAFQKLGVARRSQAAAIFARGETR
ncbi:MAG TPA: response regulator transcription factor [Usitatibacter sp.]|nr:response regulator transcription factor [Usitatibacter sp.]